MVVITQITGEDGMRDFAKESSTELDTSNATKTGRLVSNVAKREESARVVHGAAEVVPTSLELATAHYFHNRLKHTCWDEFNKELWQQTMPQTSHSSAVIWHALNSLAGSMWAHDINANPPADTVQTFQRESRRQFSLCIKHILEITQSSRTSPQEKTIILLANVALSMAIREDMVDLFTEMQGKSHGLIRLWKFWQHIDSDEQATQVMYFWLKSEGMHRESQFLIPTKPVVTWHEAIAHLQERPLSSATRAYIELQMIWSSVQAILDSMALQPMKTDISSVHKKRSTLRCYFEVWETRYDDLLSSSCSISRIQLAVLGARRNLLGVLFSLDLTRFHDLRDETCWDEFEPCFWSTFLLIESALALDDQGKSPFTPLLMNSLNFIARVCRKPVLRHRVANLLQVCLSASFANNPITAGSEDGPHALVSHIIDLEEGGWIECNEGAQRCVRDEFVCNMHRVPPSFFVPRILMGLVMMGIVHVRCHCRANRVVQSVVAAPNASCKATTLHLPDPPYENYFYSDCNVDAQAVITSPLPESNLDDITPRLIVAWPAGNSGVCAFFDPQNGEKGSLGFELVNSTLGSPLKSVLQNTSATIPTTGIEGVLSFNSSAKLSLAILGSVRTIRDYVEGGGLTSSIQDAIKTDIFSDTGAQVSRLWLDNVTTTTLTFYPWQGSNGSVAIEDKSIKFGAGLYHFSATLNYPQLKQLKPRDILNKEAMGLTKTEPEQVDALSFFSYSDKLLAGGWRFLTYFGRDSMISALLMQPIFKTGRGSAMEAVLGAALERINKNDGTVAHEETIGDYATFVNMQHGSNSTAAGFTYQMIDTDYYLHVLMDRYFQNSPDRVKSLLKTKAGKVNVANKGLTWGDLGHKLALKIMKMTEPFEKDQSAANLIHLLDGESVGQWRDSPIGLGNGRIPFDVNCALVPAALRAIDSLSAIPGVFPDADAKKWRGAARKRADVWQKHTLVFFKYTDSVSNGKSLLDNYVKDNSFYHGPSHADALSSYSSDDSFVDYGLALPNVDGASPLRITHTDTAFRNVLLFDSDDDDSQLTEFVNSTANAVLRPFPAGLTTPFGAVIANPALSGDSSLVNEFTNAAYHGTVIWGWQLALVTKGFELQLGRCSSQTGTTKAPSFCSDASVYGALKAAYNRIWDVIEDNKNTLQAEVWSWTYSNNGTGRDGFNYAPLGVLSRGTESDVRQLWSLVFLAMSRNHNYKL
ncbi:hypothetical protein NLG97_g3906 [Lecanicillium saksenae]|uniref:Uncharacterized protein n=1 Tax=Lecanicillium saksenae TaxID=468837 RepID=A0ACC1QYL1_9HYPO|nr:hypothetical protein NLG97_g3906 [Lecanicillium saksenae]